MLLASTAYLGATDKSNASSKQDNDMTSRLRSRVAWSSEWACGKLRRASESARGGFELLPICPRIGAACPRNCRPRSTSCHQLRPSPEVHIRTCREDAPRYRMVARPPAQLGPAPPRRMGHAIRSLTHGDGRRWAAPTGRPVFCLRSEVHPPPRSQSGFHVQAGAGGAAGPSSSRVRPMGELTCSYLILSRPRTLRTLRALPTWPRLPCAAHTTNARRACFNLITPIAAQWVSIGHYRAYPPSARLDRRSDYSVCPAAPGLCIFHMCASRWASIGPRHRS